MTDLPVPLSAEPLKKGQPITLAEVLPTFSNTEIPPVYIENTRFDARCFEYAQPLTHLGKAGFIVDYGYRLGYFPSTWQGQPNRSLTFQDLQQLFEIAKSRMRNIKDFNHSQLGRWSINWRIDGNHAELIAMVKKIWLGMRRPPC
jgi:hypothetical protein